MDYVLDIIIPRKEIKNIKIEERLVEWGNCVYSCTPPQYVTSSDIIFEQIEDIKYYSKIIGKRTENNVIILNLKSDILFELEYAVNNDNEVLEKNKLLNFLSELFKLSEFYILLVQEDEKVKEYYKVATKEEIVVRLLDALKWSNPKDILLFKKD